MAIGRDLFGVEKKHALAKHSIPEFLMKWVLSRIMLFFSKIVSIPKIAQLGVLVDMW